MRKIPATKTMISRTVFRVTSRNLAGVHRLVPLSFPHGVWRSSSSSVKNDKDTQPPPPSPADTTATATTTTAADLHASLFKNPIVQRLWSDRQKAKEQLQRDAAAENQDLPHPNSPTASRVQVSYPFSTDPLLLETYKNPYGQIRLGKMLEDLDALAGNIAFFHVQRSTEFDAKEVQDFPVIVTASVDRIRLRQRPAVGCDQWLSGHVTWTGRSSMEIQMRCFSVPKEANPDEEVMTKENEWLEAHVTFVTLDPHTKRPMSIPPIVPQTPLEQEEFEQGAKRAKIKKQLRQQQQKKHSGDSKDDPVETLARNLLDQAAPLLNLPSLANPHDILMEQTHMQNAMVAQPQVQNLHTRIFGGFLMRRAFELAFATVYCFAGARPIFLEVDQVSFTLPVDVGDLLVFHSHVLYTDKGKVQDYCDPDLMKKMNVNTTTTTNVRVDEELPLVHVEVEAWVTVPEEAKSQVSNQFYFTFAIAPLDTPETTHNRPPIRCILPGNIDQARRMANRMLADQQQDKIDGEEG